MATQYIGDPVIVGGTTWRPTQGGQYYANGRTINDPKQYGQMYSQAQQLSQPGYYNTGVDYSSAISPYLSGAISSATSSVPTTNTYENRLLALLDNPDAIKDTGAYKFRYDQGQKALERSAAAKGMTGSGNVLAELAKYGQGMASQAYDTEADRLAGLTGQQKSYIASMQGNATNANLGAGNLALQAARAQSGDYWNAQNQASNMAKQTGYYNPIMW